MADTLSPILAVGSPSELQNEKWSGRSAPRPAGGLPEGSSVVAPVVARAARVWCSRQERRRPSVGRW